MNILTILEKYKLSGYQWGLVGIFMIVIIGLVDYLTGYEIAFSAFYILPIALVTWLTNRFLGLIISFVASIVWFIADLAAGNSYSSSFIFFWNTLIRLTLFVTITLLFAALKQAAERERQLARIDNLTGAVNSRFFYELTQMEIDRFKRYEHPFTLSYIDLDNFKLVNDRFGHPTGDQVLRVVVTSIRKFLRRTDIIARLGGDEFALLLPETAEESAHTVLAKIHTDLLIQMNTENWPVTFSIGVITCTKSPQGVEHLIRMADELMYTVKHDQKNAIKFLAYTGI